MTEYTLQQAALKLGLSESAVRRRAKRGSLPYRRVAGGRILVDLVPRSRIPGSVRPLGSSGERLDGAAYPPRSESETAALWMSLDTQAAGLDGSLEQRAAAPSPRQLITRIEAALLEIGARLDTVEIICLKLLEVVSKSYGQSTSACG
jgi:hypothetical protein